MLSTISDSYLQSRKESKVCKNRFVENHDYIKVGTKVDFIENTKLVLFAIIFIFWILFTVVGYLLKVTDYRQEANLTILKWVPIGFSASIFIGLTIGISIGNFYPQNFCLMNSEDGICSSVETNCFTNTDSTESIFTSDFGFGKVLIIHSNAEKGKSDLGKGTKFLKAYQTPLIGDVGHCIK